MKVMHCVGLILCFAGFTRMCSADLSGPVVVFHAGSLSVPFQEISQTFMAKHPRVTVQLESAGSRACARKIVDLDRDCDVMASADYTVIDQLLIPAHAAWNIKFATNEMAIAYSETSRLASKIQQGNWMDVLMDKQVIFGRSDPNSDPCGYRAVMTMMLAEAYYKRPGLAEALQKKDTRFIRPKETDLLGLLESHSIDYIFLYRSVIEQHGLQCVLLPDAINLKQSELAEAYGKAHVKITGRKPGTFIVKQGGPMVYGLTIPKRSRNREAALAFVRFILEEHQGLAILKKMGQPSAVPSVSSTYDRIPEELKTFALPSPQL